MCTTLPTNRTASSDPGASSRSSTCSGRSRTRSPTPRSRGAVERVRALPGAERDAVQLAPGVLGEVEQVAPPAAADVEHALARPDVELLGDPRVLARLRRRRGPRRGRRTSRSRSRAARRARAGRSRGGARSARRRGRARTRAARPPSARAPTAGLRRRVIGVADLGLHELDELADGPRQRVRVRVGDVRRAEAERLLERDADLDHAQRVDAEVGLELLVGADGVGRDLERLGDDVADLGGDRVGAGSSVAPSTFIGGSFPLRGWSSTSVRSVQRLAHQESHCTVGDLDERVDLGRMRDLRGRRRVRGCVAGSSCCLPCRSCWR